MKVKLSSHIAAMSGKLSGHSVSGYKGSTIVRTRRLRSHKNTDRRVAAVTRSSTIAKLWRQLTEAQRARYFELLPIVNQVSLSTGQFYTNAYQLFYAVTTLRNFYDSTVVIFTPVSTIPLKMASAAVSYVSGSLTMNFTFSPAFSNASYYIALYASKPFPRTRVSDPNSYTLLRTAIVTTASPFNIRNVYNNTFGRTPTTGERVFFKAFFVFRNSVYINKPIFFSMVTA